jgi:hypothetical protein
MVQLLLDHYTTIAFLRDEANVFNCQKSLAVTTMIAIPRAHSVDGAHVPVPMGERAPGGLPGRSPAAGQKA